MRIANNNLSIPFRLLSEYDDLLTYFLLDSLFLDFMYLLLLFYFYNNTATTRIPKMRIHRATGSTGSSTMLESPTKPPPNHIRQSLVDCVRQFALTGDFEEASGRVLALLAKTARGQSVLTGKSNHDVISLCEHIKRYLALYHRNCLVSVVGTRQYCGGSGGSGGSGSVQAALVANRKLKQGTHLDCITGFMSPLSSHDEHLILAQHSTHPSFNSLASSLIESSRKQCSTLFLGPARLINHDCKPNCEFVPLGQDAIGFKIIRDIHEGEEVTVWYSDEYFGDNNESCLCRTCERMQINGHAPRSTTTPQNGDAPLLLDLGKQSTQTVQTALVTYPQQDHQRDRSRRWKDPAKSFNLAQMMQIQLHPHRYERRSKKRRLQPDAIDASSEHTQSSTTTTAAAAAAAVMVEGECRRCGFVKSDYYSYLATELVIDDTGTSRTTSTTTMDQNTSDEANSSSATISSTKPTAKPKLICTRCMRHFLLFGQHFPARVDTDALNSYKFLQSTPIIRGTLPTLPHAYFLPVFVDPDDPTVLPWWPALLLPPPLIPNTITVHFDTGEVGVRYFEDGTYGSVPMTALRLFRPTEEPFKLFERKLGKVFTAHVATRRAGAWLEKYPPGSVSVDSRRVGGGGVVVMRKDELGGRRKMEWRRWFGATKS